MSDGSTILDPIDALVFGPDADEFRVGLALPGSGALGLARPAGVRAAILAAEQFDRAGGIRGRRVRLVPVDAGRDPANGAAETDRLIGAGVLDAVVGFHTSDVHRAVERIASRRVPYIFTAPHEGGTRLPGVGLIGPGPRDQLAGPIRELHRAGARRWALIGNDYIWPHAVHRTAAQIIADLGGVVRGVALAPLGGANGEQLVEWVAAQRVDAVLLSLVGRDLVRFNRAFANSPSRDRIVRLSGALEESGLLEIDGDESGGLFAAMDWYARDVTDSFVADFTARWGPLAPPVGVYARGCYDGIREMARLAARGRLDAWAPGAGLPEGAGRSPRRSGRLACADGVALVPLSS